MGPSSRDRIDYRTDAGDLFDRPSTSSTIDFEDISISSCVYEPVLVGLRDEQLESRLEKEFYPKCDREIFIRDLEGNSLIIPVGELQFLAFANRPPAIERLPVSSFSDMVELYSGGLHEIRLPEGQDFDVGLFGVRQEPPDRYGYIFFGFDNIRFRSQKRLLGQIIVEKHILSPETLDTALRRQAQLRKLRVGTIIAKKLNRPVPEVEKIIQQAYQKSRNTGEHLGDLLIGSGMIPPETILQALAFQKHIRHLKLGNLLVEMGYMDEDQLYRLLADKFRKRFIDLRRNNPSDEAMHQLTQDIMVRLSVVPVYFQNKRLIIATSIPEKAATGDILRQKLSCPFELVVATQQQILEVQENLAFRPR